MVKHAMNSIVQTLINALGAGSVRSGDAIEPRYLGDWSGRSPVAPLAVVLPRSTNEVATVLRLCNDAHQSVVPQGGMTGLAGGSIPSGGDVCLSLERLAGIEEIDRAAATMTVLAGTTLQTVQDAAQEAGFRIRARSRRTRLVPDWRQPRYERGWRSCVAVGYRKRPGAWARSCARRR
jgi:FAD/FMN-containing dehydrogenase